MSLYLGIPFASSASQSGSPSTEHDDGSSEASSAAQAIPKRKRRRRQRMRSRPRHRYRPGLPPVTSLHAVYGDLPASALAVMENEMLNGGQVPTRLQMQGPRSQHSNSTRPPAILETEAADIREHFRVPYRSNDPSARQAATPLPMNVHHYGTHPHWLSASQSAVTPRPQAWLGAARNLPVLSTTVQQSRDIQQLQPATGYPKQRVSPAQYRNDGPPGQLNSSRNRLVQEGRSSSQLATHLTLQSKSVRDLWL